jgi:hypothetical protein
MRDFDKPALEISNAEGCRFKGLRFTHGKFEGRSMLEVAERMPKYITWCWENTARGMGIPPELYDLVKRKLADAELEKLRQKTPVHAGAWYPLPPSPAEPPPPEAVVEEPSFLDKTLEAPSTGPCFLDAIF